MSSNIFSVKRGQVMGLDCLSYKGSTAEGSSSFTQMAQASSSVRELIVVLINHCHECCV